jgi:hypothetical protein
MRPFCEGTRTGIALDGSMSMAESFGIDKGSKPLSKIFAPRVLENLVRPVARKIAAHLVTTLDPSGTVSAVYWSTGKDGTAVQSIGELTAAQAEAYPFDPPTELGNGTYLLPAMRYFLEKYSTAPWGFFVVITDGEIHDLSEVKETTVLLARDIAAGRRNPVKMVLILMIWKLEQVLIFGITSWLPTCGRSMIFLLKLCEKICVSHPMDEFSIPTVGWLPITKALAYQRS